MFIAYLKYYRKNWDDSKIQEELGQFGLSGVPFPETSNLRFVQLDEFFPMHPDHKNSFCHYIRTLYFSLLELKEENILTMDLFEAGVVKEGDYDMFENGIADIMLLQREPATKEEEAQKSVLLRVQKFTEEYEAKVREWGGIGMSKTYAYVHTSAYVNIHTIFTALFYSVWWEYFMRV